MNSPLRICIDARPAVGHGGGTGTFALSLARALLNLKDGDEQYVFLVDRGDQARLRLLLNRTVETIEFTPNALTQVHRMAVRIPFARTIWRGLRALVDRLQNLAGYSKIATTYSPAKSDGTLEQNNIDIVHFTTQNGFLTDIPFIYHPHDLQHKHLPEFFTPVELSQREHSYSAFSNRASMVCVSSQWVKQDLMDNLSLPESKIRVIHFAPEVHNCLQPTLHTAGQIAPGLSLPQRFIFYPARTWPHKNHLRLIRALAVLKRNHGLNVPLVCSGEPTEFYAKIKAEIRALGLKHQIFFVGFVSSENLSTLYHLCSAVVIPTLFEAGSFPMWEAFLAEKPAACSNVTSLPAQAGDAALIFDPYNVEEIAGAVKKLWTDHDFCDQLVAKGRTNISRFSWETTARTFRAVYRQLGNRPLTSDDQMLLSAQPLM